MKVCVLCLLLVGAYGRTIDVKLTAPWPTSAISPVLEVAEFLAEEDKFWEFVNGLRSNDTASLLSDVEKFPYSESSHEQVSSLAVETASDLLSPLQLSALRLSLSVRAFAPLIETTRSLASLTSHACKVRGGTQHVSSWAIVHPSGRVVCDVGDLEKSVTAESWDIIVSDPTANDGIPDDKLEHVYDFPASAPPLNKQSITLYSRLGTSEFWQFHDRAAELYTSGKVSRYSLRHSIPNPATTTSTALQGYGVNLDIKNMEYMNMDDSHESAQVLEGGNSEDAGEVKPKVEFEEDENVNGFIFSKLLSRKPELGEELSKLRQEFVEENGANADDGQMKVWKMKDLGMQATHSIMKDKDPLSRLMEVSQNFPIYANDLSRIRLDKSMKEEVKRIANSGLMK
jgi:hypothetical protein